MSDDARQVIEEALRLPVKERSTVVAELLASLDGERDGDSDDACAAAIERRATRALHGESQGKDWATVSGEIEAKHRRR